MEENKKQLELILKYFADFDETQINQFSLLKDLYEDWNSKINVISRKDIDALYEKHVLHSLAIAAVADFPDGSKIIDIGTGGGFPGIPLAIYFPKVQFHLVDSIGKKLKVVEAVAQSIGLQNITTQHCRAEEIKNRKFDYVVSRAVAPLKEIWTWSKPLLKKKPNSYPANGLFCLKGGDLNVEISESGVRPRMMKVSDIFQEPFFEEKFIMHVQL
jgi:16S rRNA (guanine527-N7)-methyltransferase